MDPQRHDGHSGAGVMPTVSVSGVDIAGILAPMPAAQPTRAELLARVAALEGKLLSLPAIEQAKGALMVTYGLSADAAFALLRFHSQQRNVKVRAIAAQLTALMSANESSSQATVQFDRLLDDVSRHLQITSGGNATGGRLADRSVAGVTPEIDADEMSEVTLQAVATAPPGITIAGYGPDRPLIYANDAFTEMTGYREADVLGRNCRFLQGPETNPKDVDLLSLALREGRDISVVMRNYRSSGEPFWNEVSISPIRNRTNQITHYVGTQIDITSRIDAARAAAPVG